MLQSRAEAAAYRGRLREARALITQAGRIVASRHFDEGASALRLDASLIEAVLGNKDQAIREALAALSVARTVQTLRKASLVLAFADDHHAADAALDEWTKQSSPEFRRERASVIGPVQALESLSRGDPTAAFEHLENAGSHDLTGQGGYLPIYVRGLTYLVARDSRAAVAEFQRILDHRGLFPTSVFYPLSALQQARAYAQAGDHAASRRAYETFFTLWKDADSDVPALVDARREYSALK